MGEDQRGDGDELTIVLADDQAATRIGIRAALEPHGLRVVAEASTAGEALAATLRLKPDVCLLSASLPGGGIDVTRMIKDQLSTTRVVMLSPVGLSDELFGALRAGADGYLLMTTSPDRLPHAIRGVVNGEAALPRALTAQLIQEFRDQGGRRRLTITPDREPVELTAREFEVLEHLRQHERTAEIARRLGISEVTVRRHVSSILGKLRAPNRRTALAMLDGEAPASTRAAPASSPVPPAASTNASRHSTPRGSSR